MGQQHFGNGNVAPIVNIAQCEVHAKTSGWVPLALSVPNLWWLAKKHWQSQWHPKIKH